MNAKTNNCWLHFECVGIEDCYYAESDLLFPDIDF